MVTSIRSCRATMEERRSIANFSMSERDQKSKRLARDSTRATQALKSYSSEFPCSKVTRCSYLACHKRKRKIPYQTRQIERISEEQVRGRGRTSSSPLCDFTPSFRATNSLFSPRWGPNKNSNHRFCEIMHSRGAHLELRGVEPRMILLRFILRSTCPLAT